MYSVEYKYLLILIVRSTCIDSCYQVRRFLPAAPRHYNATTDSAALELKPFEFEIIKGARSFAA